MFIIFLISLLFSGSAFAFAQNDFINNSSLNVRVIYVYEGFGETLPLAENDSSYGRLLNRRTEIVVYFN
jgi:flagellar motor protein MotB